MDWKVRNKAKLMTQCKYGFKAVLQGEGLQVVFGQGNTEMSW